MNSAKAISYLVLGFLPLLCVRAAEADSKPELVSRTGGGSTWSNVAELQKASDSGNAEAQAAMGEMLVTGDQVPKDVTKGVELLAKAAAAKQATAAFRLGKLYEDGDGVAPDASKALEYYLQAARAGVSEAQYNLGAMYVSARDGLKRDYKEGLAWLIVATKHGANGEGEAKVRERLKKTHREALIAEGEQRAQEIEKEIASASGHSEQKSDASPSATAPTQGAAKS